MDCDNDHSDNPEDWITAEKLAGMLPDVGYAIVPSRNNMRDKNGTLPRPRFHAYFQIDEITDADDYAALKRAIYEKFSFFDGNALDAARFIFGADSGEVIWHDGTVSIVEMVGWQSGKAVQSAGTVSNSAKGNPQDRDTP